MSPETELMMIQRNEFGHYLVRIAVALNLVNGTEPYTGDQIAFLADAAIEKICDGNRRASPGFAAERQAFLDAMPKLRSILPEE